MSILQVNKYFILIKGKTKNKKQKKLSLQILLYENLLKSKQKNRSLDLSNKLKRSELRVYVY